MSNIILSKSAVQDFYGQPAAPSNPPSGMCRMYYRSDNDTFNVIDSSGTSLLGTGTGTVTSVGLVDSTGLFTVTGSPVTGSGNLTLSALASQTQKTFLAAPNGSSGAPTFRAIVASDVPTLNQNTSGTSAGLTGTPNISIGTLAASGSAVFSSNADKVGQAVIVTDSGAINTTETIIAQSAALPASRIQAGTVIRVTLWGACTTTVANTSTFKIRIGTAGTTSDTAVFSYTTAAAGTTGTLIPFKAVMDVTFRTTGASATSFGNVEVLSKTNTGIIPATIQVDSMGNGTTFNTTTASLIISASYLSAATTTTSTFHQAFIEVVNQ